MMNSENQHGEAASPLKPSEAQVLDAMIESMSAARRAETFGQSAGPVGFVSPNEDPRCAAAVSAWLDLIGRCPCESPSANLTEQTLARVKTVRRQRWFAEQAQALAAPRVGMSWNEIGAIAAMLLISLSLVWPMVTRYRGDVRRVGDASNLAAAGMAVGSYAGDFNDHMPRRNVVPGTVWWNVGRQARDGEPIQSNSAHLYILVRRGYVSPDVLNSPANPHAPAALTTDMQDWPSAATVSYSYQNQYNPKTIRIEQAPTMAILADKNPLFEPVGGPGEGLRFRSDLLPTTATVFHNGRGQNILLGDGNVLWSTKPVLPNGDNIWLAHGVDHYTGTETPADPFDSFLVP